MQILERGGNAIDAAIAANATIGPDGADRQRASAATSSSSITTPSPGTVHGLNSSGWAPTGLTPDYLAAKGINEMPQRGIYSVTVPGRRRRLGRDAREDSAPSRSPSCSAPAIYYAENGFPLSEIIARAGAAR